MRKGTKISLIVLAVLFAILAAAFIYADVIVSRLVHAEVAKAMKAAPGCEAKCGDIHIRFFSGTVSLYDLSFSYRGESINKKDTIGPGVKIAIERIDIGRIFYTMLMNRQILVSDVYIRKPQLELWMDEEHPEKCFPELHDQHIEEFNNPFESATLINLHIKHADFKLHSVRTHLDLDVEDCSLTVHDLAYDSVFTYNDSVYRFELAKAAVLIPDGSMRIETSELSQSDQGPLEIGPTRICNTMPRKKMGDIHKEPVTWMDMHIASVKTSEFNPLRKAMNKDLTLDHITAQVAKMDVFRDERYAPKKPFPMPQEVLLGIPMVFKINQVDAGIEKIDIEFASTNINCGELHLGGIKTHVTNVCNARNAVMRIKGSCPIKKGKAEAQMSMTMNKNCDFTTKLHCANVDADFMNSFIRPLVGITFKLQLDTLDTQYSGNKEKATGTFRMLYHGLEVKVHGEDDIPYKIVTKNANSFTTLANTLIPKSNPTAVDIHPRAYQVEWKRDQWKPFPLYMFGPCIEGAKETLLPGLYVHKQVSNNNKK